MASHVERLIDFLERQLESNDMPKVLLEDIEWAIEVISANKLYSGNLDNIKFNKERPEIKEAMYRDTCEAYVMKYQHEDPQELDPDIEIDENLS